MGATVIFLCEKVVVPAAVHPQAVPAARAASVSIKLRAAADFTPTCFVNRAAVRAENTALVMSGNRCWSVYAIRVPRENDMAFCFKGVKV